jgi:hypothetical protein
MVALFGQTFTREALLQKIGRLDQVAGVRLFTLGDGVERGVRVLEFRTGAGFSFDVLVDRAFDIGRAEYNGMALAWQSATGFTGPWYAEHEGFGWLRGFGGGLLTTCGLDHALFQAQDSATQYRYPPRETVNYGLHGRISNRPARLVGYGERWEGDECILYAEGEVLQAMAMGEALLLRRRIEARVGSTALEVFDTVTNVGAHRTPHMLLYHINYGFPVVDEGAEIVVPAASFTPAGEYPAQGFTTLDAPRAEYTERVYQYEPIAETGGTVPAAILNRARGIGAYQVYHRAQFPHPLIWRMLGAGNYVVGIEPSTNRVAGRHDARQRGELIELDAGASRSYHVEIGALTNSASLEAFAARVGALNGIRA